MCGARSQEKEPQANKRESEGKRRESESYTHLAQAESQIKRLGSRREERGSPVGGGRHSRIERGERDLRKEVMLCLFTTRRRQRRITQQQELL